MHKEPFLYHGHTTENHGNITEMPRKITEGFFMPITEILEALCGGWPPRGAKRAS